MTTDAASLIATLIPIGILILAVEARGFAEGTVVGPGAAPLKRLVPLLFGLVSFVGAVGTFVAVSIVITVSSDTFFASVVLTGGVAVWATAGGVTVFLTGRNFGHGIRVWTEDEQKAWKKDRQVQKHAAELARVGWKNFKKSDAWKSYKDENKKARKAQKATLLELAEQTAQIES